MSILSGILAFPQKNYKTEWASVDSLSNLGQPKTALEIVEKIYSETKEDNNSPEFLKASIYRMSLMSHFEEEYLEKCIALTSNDIENSVQPVKNVLQSMLAELYWRYYESNRYKFLNRTETKDYDSQDLRTWDLRKLVHECILNYTKSLENAQVIKQIKLEDFKPILLKTSDTRSLRPTLYDFLVHRAIDFYLNTESGLTQPSSRFLIDNPLYFEPTPDFLKMDIRSADTFSFQYQAIQLIKDVIQFHYSDPDPAALIDVELKRLRFVHDNCILPEKDSLYLQALQNLEGRFTNHPAAADISFELASFFVRIGTQYLPLVSDNHKWDVKEAMSVCNKAIKQFPDSDGAYNCRSLVAQIKEPSFDITTEYASVPGISSLALVNYRNVNQLYFRLIKADPEEDHKMNESGQQDAIKVYTTYKFKNAWMQSLPADGDFQEHKAEIKLPATDPGYYVLLSSLSKDFNEDSIISINRIWSTNISFISRRNDNGTYDIFTLDRQEGQPLQKVNVQQVFREYDYNLRAYKDMEGPVLQTDVTGYVKVLPVRNNKSNQYYLVFSTQKDKFITESYFSSYSYDPGEPKTIINTYFFTDRSIYRPGQTIYFKGIVIEKKKDEAKIKPDYRSTVTFYDVNGQKISSQILITNEFGSFSGTFTAPQGTLTGQMNIQGENGYISINVEEYKRPKFETKFMPLTGSYKLNESISIKGKATAFSGNPVSEAQVSYRVFRTARFPYMWRGWRSWFPESPEMEIVNGNTTSDAEGAFMVNFKAIPDPTIQSKFDPVFDYKIRVSVSDINGETHEAESTVSVGTKALFVSTNLPDEVNLDSTFQFSLTSSNLQGQKEPCQGKISISKLVEPKRLLRNRIWSRPDLFTMNRDAFEKEFPNDIYENEGEINTWPKEKQLFERNFNTKTDSLFSPQIKLPVGSYVLEIETTDTFGSKIESKKFFSTYAPGSDEIAGGKIGWFAFPTVKAEPGEEISFLAGSATKKVHVIYELSKRNSQSSIKLVEVAGQKRFTVPVTEDCRGNFGVAFTFVKFNRIYSDNSVISVPFTNKQLDIQFASFRSKLEPGQDEKWQITLKDKKGDKVMAEMLASMYDASLDAFLPHDWTFNLYNNFSFTNYWETNSAFGTRGSIFNWFRNQQPSLRLKEYEELNWFGFEFYGNGRFLPGIKYAMADRSMDLDEKNEKPLVVAQGINSKSVAVASVAIAREESMNGGQKGIPPVANTNSSNSQSPKIRTDFNETAFFYPQLQTNQDGDLVIKFKIPESLTKWKMQGLAYTKDLKAGLVEKELVTQKDLMVFPNAPRFFREGDTMFFSVKISNISSTPLHGSADLHFFDALTMKPIDALMKNDDFSKPFILEKGMSCVVNWGIYIPEGLQAVVYRVSATSGTFSDGEEAPVPVLSNRMLVTESMPLPINGNQTKSFTFEKLINSGKSSSSLINKRLTLEFTSNPAWFAVQSLPYLMEYPYECAEQLFSRYYSNSIASFIANSDPKIKRVFDSWKNISPDALKSNLEKNQELKSILLEESPWVREAANESERKQRIALLFDLNRMSNELATALKKLKDLQVYNGGWPWFPGMPESRYITQHIVTGIGHLDHLGVTSVKRDNQTWDMLQNALRYLDDRIADDLKNIKKDDKDYLTNDHLGFENIQYLYARSYFVNDVPISESNKEAFNYFKSQATTFWKTRNNYMKGMIALALNRFGDKKTPSLVMRSVTDKALHNEEMGMYWRDEQPGWFWYQAPVETQALLIEAYDEVLNDTKSVDELKIWLLKQKQTQDWKTTKATTEAVYALLLRGTNLLAGDNLAKINVGDQVIDPAKLDGINKPEAGTGYYKVSWEGTQINPGMGKVKVTNQNSTVAWGSLYWQYFEQLDKITPANTPLKVSKKLFREIASPTGPVIEPVSEAKPLHVGDKVIVRIELRTDRDMEYVHLKDMRAATFEPMDVLSGYHWQDGLGYYQSTRDASESFFINYLSKGTYVFEYRLFATQKGEFSNGITSVECMYAPELAAHTEGVRVKVE